MSGALEDEGLESLNFPRDKSCDFDFQLPLLPEQSLYISNPDTNNLNMNVDPLTTADYDMDNPQNIGCDQSLQPIPLSLSGLPVESNMFGAPPDHNHVTINQVAAEPNHISEVYSKGS
jgi:hypothetical protein